MQFPYKNLYLTPEVIKSRFENLKSYIPNIIPYSGVIRINNIQGIPRNYHWGSVILFESGDYFKYNEISDFFTEECRVVCKRKGDDESILDFWNSHSKDYSGCSTLFEAREKLSSSFYEVGTFRPTIVPCVVDLLRLDPGMLKVLDFSAGWGDRLIAFLALGVSEYVGIDPNRSLHAKYNDIVNFFNYANTRTTFHQSAFEEWDSGQNGYFDLVMTSPPYFDLEKYSDDPSQSTNKHSSFEDWYTKFLLFSCEKSIRLLKKGGYLVLALNNAGQGSSDYTLRLVKDLTRRQGIKFLGMIPYCEMYPNKKLRSPQPIWIFKKCLV